MGAQRVLQAAAVIVCACAAVVTAAPRGERIAVVDLGPEPANDAARKQIAGAIVAAGFEAVVGDGVEDALAGIVLEPDAAQLAAALAEAQRAYGAFDCKTAIASAQTVAGIGAARQAGGLAVPELPRAWALILLCADRTTNVDLAMRAAARLRTVGGSPDVPADVLAKYPEVDTIVDRELVPLEITADVGNAQIWVDHQLVGTAPVTVMLPVGHHIIAASAGTRRGWASGTAVRTQTKLAIPTTEHGTQQGALAKRVAGWKGAMPSPAELGSVLGQVKARIAIVRRGDQLEVWGRPGVGGMPHLLGGEDGKGALGELDRLLALVADRSKAWKDRAPDPDQPLLLEDRSGSNSMLRTDGSKRDSRTKWWVYASIAGTVVAGAILVYSLDGGGDRQRVELVWP